MRTRVGLNVHFRSHFRVSTEGTNSTPCPHSAPPVIRSQLDQHLFPVLKGFHFPTLPQADTVDSILAPPTLTISTTQPNSTSGSYLGQPLTHASILKASAYKRSVISCEMNLPLPGSCHFLSLSFSQKVG